MNTRRVIGVRYTPEDTAPKVIAKGAGEEAEAMLAAARAANAYIVKDAGLTERLYRVPIDAPVGRELFPVMAVLLAHVLQVDQNEGGRHP